MGLPVKFILFGLMLYKALCSLELPPSQRRTPINPVRATINSERVPINPGKTPIHTGGTLFNLGQTSFEKDEKDQTKIVINKLIEDIIDSNVFSDFVFIGDVSYDVIDNAERNGTREKRRIMFSKVVIDIHFIIEHIYKYFDTEKKSKSCSKTQDTYLGDGPLMIAGINRMQEKDTKNTLFLIIPPKTVNPTRLNALVQEIKKSDQSSKILIVYKIPPRHINNRLFWGQPDVYAFIPDSSSRGNLRHAAILQVLY